MACKGLPFTKGLVADRTLQWLRWLVDQLSTATHLHHRQESGY
ncbi:MAG: hypothetical protein ACREQ3_05840 [Candidatus Binatia bacterium]